MHDTALVRHKPAIALLMIAVLALASAGACQDDDLQDHEPEGPLSPTIETDDQTVYFPRRAKVQDPQITPAGDPRDVLEIDDAGCLYMVERGALIIWPTDVFDVAMVDGEVAVIDEEDDEVIARPGDNVVFHGGSPTSDPPPLEYELPEACADYGSFFVTGGSTERDE